MTPFDHGWVVGILEGEGAFVCSKDKRTQNTYNVKIQVESTDKDVIDKLQELVPGQVWESNYPAKYRAFPNAKPSWRWAISSKKKVEQLSFLIYPLMSKRRQQQLDKLVEHCEYKRKLTDAGKEI